MRSIWVYASLVFLGGCCFGILSTFVKLAYSAGFSLGSVTTTQFLCGFLLIWLIAPFARRVKQPRGMILALLASGVPMGLTGVLYYQSLQSIDASLAIIFLFQFVWIGSFIEWIIEKKKPKKHTVIAIIVLLVGSVLAGGFLLTTTTITWYGVAWGLGAALTFSLFIYLSGRIGADVPALQKSAWLTTGGFIVVFLIFLPALPGLSGQLINVLPYGLLLGIFGVFLPPILFSIGMPKVGGGLGSILSSSELPVAILMSTIVLGEIVSFSQWIGVILILLGIGIANQLFTTNKKRKMINQKEVV